MGIGAAMTRTIIENRRRQLASAGLIRLLSDEELEIGDHAIHGNEVYPSDVPTLGGPDPPGWASTPPAGP